MWMAAVVILYQPLPRNYQTIFVALATLVFLSIYSPWSALTLSAMSGVSYFSMRRWRNSNGAILLVILCIASLFAGYKYMLQVSVAPASQKWFLLGVSFYVLRIIHYVIESYKGSLERHGFVEYLAYMWFLPVIVIGPINRFDEFLREQRRRRWDSRQFAMGLERILYGYVKIVLLAGYLLDNILKTWVPSINSGRLWLLEYVSCLEYGLDLYLKFSGYSDIAIGFALLLGVRVSENFHYPFFQPNISQFWRSWHISLSSWCRDYVYMPITAHFRRPYVGIIASMLILGLWHELSMRYVLWGIYHGLGIVAWRYFQHIKPRWLSSMQGPLQQLFHCLSVALTFNFVVLSFQITRSEDIFTALHPIRHYLVLFLGGN